MNTVFSMRYKMDFSIIEDGPKKGSKESKVQPIGAVREIRGTKEEIKERLCRYIDDTAFKLEDLYYGEE